MTDPLESVIVPVKVANPVCPYIRAAWAASTAMQQSLLREIKVISRFSFGPSGFWQARCAQDRSNIRPTLLSHLLSADLMAALAGIVYVLSVRRDVIPANTGTLEGGINVRKFP